MALITSGGLKEVILQFEMKTTSDEILEAVWVKVCSNIFKQRVWLGDERVNT